MKRSKKEFQKLLRVAIEERRARLMLMSKVGMEFRYAHDYLEGLDEAWYLLTGLYYDSWIEQKGV